MKKTRISGKVALIALAAVCLLAVPALSMPLGDGSGRAGHGAMFDLKNNLTPEELDNMTLGELREMKMEAMNQSQFCQAGDRNCSQYCRGTKGQMMGGNGPNGQMMGGNGPKGQMDGNGPNGQMMGRDSFQSGRCQGVGSDDGMGRMRGNPATLLMDDMDLEDLSNMTVAQVRDLIQTKMQELDNMTLSQIKQLELERMQKREKMTLSELREENGKRQEMAGILGLAAVRPEPVA